MPLQQRYHECYARETTLVRNGTTIRTRDSSSHLEKWGLESGGYVLFTGRFSPEKNCHQLIEAYEQLETPVKLVLAGGSSYTDVYADELRKHRSDRIIFLDWVSGEALDQLLANAALFVLPCDIEGLSLALLDAMGAALCVLTSDIPENLEIIEGAGFSYRRGDAEDLRRMMALLLADETLRHAAGKNAQQKVKNEYLWPQIAADIEQIYEQVTGRRATAQPPMRRGAPAGEPETRNQAA